MPDTAIITATFNGTDFGKSLVLVAGVPVTVVANPLIKADGVNLQDISGPKIDTIDAKRKTPLKWTFTPTATGKRTFQFEVRLKGGTAGKVSFNAFVVAADAQATPPAATPAKSDGACVPPAPTNDTQAPVMLDGRTLRLGLSDLAHAPYSVTKPVVDALHLGSFRLWYGSQGFGRWTADGELLSANTYERAGLSGLYCVAETAMTPAKAYAAAAWLLAMVGERIKTFDADPSTKGRVVRVELGNEPDLKGADGLGVYWRGTIDEYATWAANVARALRAAFGSRVQIFVAGFSWNIGELERIAPALAPYVDGLCFHGYPEELTDALMDRYGRFFRLCAKLKLLAIISEGSPGFGKAVKAGTKTVADHWAPGWQAYLLKLQGLAAAAGIVAEVILFNARNIGTTNSAGAVCNDDWTLTACGKAVQAVAA